MKYGSAGVSLLWGQLSHATSFDYLDPITTVIKLCLIGYKNIGTKIGITNHMLLIQDPSLLQGLTRFIHGDDRNQLYQIRWPIVYFKGLQLGYIESTLSETDRLFLADLDRRALAGLQRLKITYNTNIGSITTNSLDNYVEILSEPYTTESFTKDSSTIFTPMIMNIYQEYLKKWTPDDFQIIQQLFQAIDKKQDRKAQNGLCATIDSYLRSKNAELATVRPI